MKTMVALAVRDRRSLVEACLASIQACGLAAVSDIWAWLDPLDTETGPEWLAERGVDRVVCLDWMPVELTPKQRVQAMRRSAAEVALERRGTVRCLLYLDSDVALSKDFALEFERLWPEVEAHGCGALTLGNFKGYEKQVVERVPGLGFTVRAHGLGACLAFPVPGELHKVAGIRTAPPPTQSWDTHYSTVVAHNRVLTSDVSYVRHDGKGTGMGRHYPDLDFHDLAADLRA